MALVATGTFERIVALAAIIFVANYCVCYIALIVLRVREPHAPRPFRAWGYPWTTALLVAGSGLFHAANALSDPGSTVYAVLLLCACVPAYLFKRKRGRTGTA